jgi:hypothetical protein
LHRLRAVRCTLARDPQAACRRIVQCSIARRWSPRRLRLRPASPPHHDINNHTGHSTGCSATARADTELFHRLWIEKIEPPPPINNRQGIGPIIIGPKPKERQQIVHAHLLAIANALLERFQGMVSSRRTPSQTLETACDEATLKIFFARLRRRLRPSQISVNQNQPFPLLGQCHYLGATGGSYKSDAHDTLSTSHG